MVFKFIGSIMVIFSSYFIGYALARDYSRRPSELRELQSLLQMLENEMIYLSNFLTEAFDKISRSNSSTTACFFKSAADNLKNIRNMNAAQAWEMAVRNNIKKTSLSHEDEEILVSFGKMLGSSDVEGQVKNIRLTLNQLKLQEQKAEELRGRNETMYRRLGVMGGLALVIILI